MIRLASQLLFILFVGLLFTGCGEKSPEDYLQEAAKFEAQSNYEGAVVALKNAVQETPRSAQIRFELGKIYIKLDMYEEASKELARAREYGYDESIVLPKLALALSRSSANVALAELTYDSSKLMPTKQIEVGTRIVTSLLALDRIPQASALVDELLLMNVNSVYSGILKSYQFAIGQNIPSAISNINNVLQASPNDRDVINVAARLHMLNKDILKASKLYKKYLVVAPNDIEAKFALISLLMEQKAYNKAEKYIDELLVLNANNSVLNLLKASVRSQDNDYVSAKKFAEASINDGSTDLNARVVAGLASYKIEDFDSAVRHLLAVADSLPNNHPALTILADSQLALNNAVDATKILSRIDNNGSDELRLFPRANYGMIKSGNIDTAKNMITEGQKTNKTTNALVRTAALKLAVNDLSGIADLEQALQKEPRSYEIKTTLAGAYVLAKQVNKGLAFAKQWQRDQPTMVDGYILEADILAMQQKYAEADAIVDTALSIDSTNVFVQLASIMLDMQLEKYEEGLNKVKALLDKEPANAKLLASYYKITSELGDSDEATTKIKQAAANNSDNEALKLLHASILVEQKQFKEAVDTLEAIDANRFTIYRYWQLKGMALYNMNSLDELLVHYNKWSNLFPNDINATLGLIQILDMQGDYGQAATAATRFLENNEALQLEMIAAYYYAKAGDVSRAKRALFGLPKGIDATPYVRGTKARIAVLEGRGKQAVDDAKAAYMAAKTADNLQLYAQTLDLAGKNNEAFAIVQQHVGDFPTDANSKSMFALRLAAVDPALALSTFESLLNDFPNNPGLLNNAAYLHYEAQNYAKAYEYSAKAHATEPSNLDYADTYAQVLMQRDNASEAVEAYNLAIYDSVTNEDIILNYIEALLVEESTSTAKRKIQQYTSRLKSQESRDRLLQLQIRYLN
jgi:putative PEP-CTERM system TPR-repeat lipoprotein